MATWLIFGMSRAAAAGDENVELGSNRQAKQDAIFHTGPADVSNGQGVMVWQLVPECVWDVLVQQYLHFDNSRSRSNSNAAITCSGRTDG